MKHFERVANEIVAYINSKEARLMEAITMHGSRFILCGTSGSGKTRAIELANRKLPSDQQIVESQEMLHCKHISDAETVFWKKDLEYQGARHIGFNVIKTEIASKIHDERVKVFWLNVGSSRAT